ncbi:MAG: regulatory protein RecX [Bacteroidota bacterium]|nr:regulatory protein RecX [Bacteroidota bacterium]
MNDSEKRLTPQQALTKIEFFCAYQERCHQEVLLKLKSYGLNQAEQDQILVKLIHSDFINEERFAKAFAGGKFRQKKWGKTKIILELKKRKISDYCINKALSEIEEINYDQTIEALASKYFNTIKQGQLFIRQQKTIKYLMGKGYEYDLCQETVKKLVIISK